MKRDRLLKLLKHTQLPHPSVARTGKDFLRLMQDREPLILVSADKLEKALKSRDARGMNLDDENVFIIGDF